MTLGDWIDAIVDEAKEDMRDELRAEVAEEISEEVTEKVSKEVTEKVSKEVTEKSIEILVEMFQEYNDTKENAVIKLQTKYPDFADQAVEFVEKYWK